MPTPPRALLCFLVPALLPAPSGAQPTLVKDINLSSVANPASSPAQFVRLGTTTYFVATTPQTGAELFRSDGSSTGTSLVIDLNPGAAGSSPSALVSFGGRLFFTADDGARGRELWSTDGTAAGTTLVKDVNPGTPEGVSQYGSLVVAGSFLYFVAAADSSLWRSDGTAAGTVQVKDVWPNSTSDNVQYLQAWNNTLYFCANDGTTGFERWRSDGTAAGTTLVYDLNPGSGSGCGPFVVMGSFAYHAGATAAGDALIKTNMTLPGTTALYTFSSYPSISALTAIGSTLYFSAREGAAGAEPWRSDGTPAGTQMVIDLYPGGSAVGPYGSFPNYFTELGGYVYFSARTSTTGYELFRTDGTAVGTTLFYEIASGTADGFPQALTRLGNEIVFHATSATSGRELWKTNGTAGGTVMLKDISPGAGSGSAGYALGVLGTSEIWFAANDGTTGLEPWVTNGTSTGTRLLRDIAQGFASASPSALTELSGALVFLASDGSGNELYSSDGSAQGTAPIVDLNPSTHGASSLFKGGNLLLFAGNQPATGSEPWRSDGTASGTQLLIDLVAGTGGSGPRPVAHLGSTFFFVATPSGSSSRWLYRTSGNPAAGNSTPVRDLGSAYSTVPVLAKVVGSRLFFSASDASTGTELWAVTESGVPTLIKDISAGSASAFGTTAVEAVDGAGTLYFVANDGANGPELWKSDGTAVGTTLVKDIAPGAAGSSPRQLTWFEGALYFVADDGVHGLELWRSDGTGAGTGMLKDIEAGATGSAPSSLTVVGSSLYFSAFTSPRGRELAKTDGTATGTVFVRDVAPGALSGGPLGLTAVGGTLLFAAWTPQAGLELWRSDGTFSGTTQVADLAPGLLSSSPGNFTAAGGKLYFTATTAGEGQELWQTALAAFDSTPPEITPVITGTLGTDGWYRSDIALTWSVEDLESSVSATTGCAPLQVTADTAGVQASCSATSAGGTATATITLKRDTGSPSVSCPGPQAIEATGAEGATASFALPSATDSLDPNPAVTASPAPGTPLGLGSHSVTVTATDAAGNTSSCTFQLTVADTVPPALTCPAAPGPSEAQDPEGAPVTYSSASATDAVTASPAITYSHPSGSVFPLGATSVVVTATDGASNSSTCTFDVLVRDTTPPGVRCPASTTAEATAPTGTPVLYPSATASDSVSPVTMSYSHPAGFAFPVGTTQVIATATDSSQNTASCAFNVTVRDTTPPVINCPPEVTGFARGAGEAEVTFSVAADDVGDPQPVVSYSHPPGSRFPVGQTTVTVTATDVSGNSETCQLSVSVSEGGAGGCGCQGGAGGLLPFAAAALLGLARRRRGRVRGRPVP